MIVTLPEGSLIPCEQCKFYYLERNEHAKIHQECFDYIEKTKKEN